MKMDYGVHLVLSLIAFSGALYGVLHYLKDIQENACDMTYMFEYPEYAKIPLNYNSSVKFPRYNLFIYLEGKYGEDLDANGFKGIPVLFIPGNAGSHRQVRSLASVALRMSQSRQTALHFNFFTIDFNEEISALYGGTLAEQTEFVLECIKHIQALYSVKKKMILIGHSMGGVIAKAVFSLSDLDPSDIFLILTLASPHHKPVISMDSDIVSLYDKIQTAWRYRLKAELKNIPIVSIGGGERDVLVRSDLIINDFEYSSALDVHVLTSSIPGVWLSTDHLAIVWCKQLVLTICRSLFDLSGLPSDAEPSVVESILKFHYVSKSSGSSSWPALYYLPVHSFSSSAEWIQREGNPWRFSRSKVLSTIYLLIPLSQGDSIIVVASGLVKGDWLFGCTRTEFSKTGSKLCTEGENLSDQGEVIPSRKANMERRMVNLKVQDLRQKGYSALIVYIAPVKDRVEVLNEAYSQDDHTKHFNLPSFERFFSLVPHRVFTISLVQQIVFYNVTLSRSAGLFLATELQLETRLCRAGSVVGQGLIKMHIPWSGESSFYHIRSSLGGLTHVPVMLHTLPPADTDPVVHLEIILDPECSVVLTAKFPLSLMASQFVKFYGTYAIGYTVAFLLMLLSDQMETYGYEGMLPTIRGMFGKLSSFFILVILPSLFHFLIRLSGLLSVGFLAKPDEINACYSFRCSVFLRTLLYLIGCGAAFCIYTCIECLLRGIFMCVIFWKRKNILKTTQMPLEQITKDRVQISKIVLVWSSLIAAVCVGISSSLACILASVYYFFKLASMHTRCKLEEDRRGSSTVTCRWYFHSLLLLLWLVSLLLVFPGAITWWRNATFSLKLSRDLYVFPSALMVISSAVLWQLPTPTLHRVQYRAAALLIRILALVTTLYGISSVYRLIYYVAAAFAIVCMQQTWAYFRSLADLKHD